MTTMPVSRQPGAGQPNPQRPGLTPPVRAGRSRPSLARYADLALAAGVVATVAMMVVPLPAALLDLLISLNILRAVLPEIITAIIVLSVILAPVRLPVEFFLFGRGCLCV